MDMLGKLDALMQRDGINKHQLATLSGIPYTTIDGLYKKGYQNIRLPTLKTLADFFGVSMEYLSSDGDESVLPPESLEAAKIPGYSKLNDAHKEVVKQLVDGLLRSQLGQ